MAVFLAVKLQHDLHVESKSNPPMNVCAGISGLPAESSGVQPHPFWARRQPLLAPVAAAPLAPTGL